MSAGYFYTWDNIIQFNGATVDLSAPSGEGSFDAALYNTGNEQGSCGALCWFSKNVPGQEITDLGFYSASPQAA